MTQEREERAKEQSVAAKRLAEVQAELREEREAKDHHVQCRRMMLMAHERIEGLEGFKRKYDALKESYDAKASEVSQLQQKLTTQSLGCDSHPSSSLGPPSEEDVAGLVGRAHTPCRVPTRGWF